MVDGNGFIQILAPAGHLTQCRTDSADNRGKGISLLDDLDGPARIIVPDQPHILSNIDARWTRSLAWGYTSSSVYSLMILRVTEVSRMICFGQALSQGPAPGTFFRIHLGQRILAHGQGNRTGML